MENIRVGCKEKVLGDSQILNTLRHWYSLGPRPSEAFFPCFQPHDQAYSQSTKQKRNKRKTNYCHIHRKRFNKTFDIILQIHSTIYSNFFFTIYGIVTQRSWILYISFNTSKEGYNSYQLYTKQRIITFSSSTLSTITRLGTPADQRQANKSKQLRTEHIKDIYSISSSLKTNGPTTKLT